MKRRGSRSGFTTGSAATAAAKAALIYLISGVVPKKVRIVLVEGETLDIPICSCAMKENFTECTVIKDAGDDPDVTNRAVIGARVGFSEEGEYTDVLGQFRFPGEECEVLIRGGEGVGMVTKPGLEIPVGDWAINPGPRRMIARNITEVAQKMLSSGRKIWVEIFVPEGKRLARKTLNSRLGIIGGISILGTTGIVRPMSHEAYKMSIGLAINVAEAMKQDTLVLTTGRRSEKFAMSHWRDIREEAFVQIGDYFEFALDAASRKEIFDRVNMAVFFGKALKMACGTPHTHASQSDIDLNRLSLWASEITDDGELCDRIKNANTAREALKWIKKGDMRVIHIVGSNMIGSARRFSGNSVDVRGVIFDFDGKIIFDSEKELQR